MRHQICGGEGTFYVIKASDRKANALFAFQNHAQASTASLTKKRQNNHSIMSVPKELLESMLSAYMDDVLSQDERNRVEQMLAGDSSMNAQLEEMRTNRAALRQIRVLDSQHRLPEHFAQSVIEATVERARSEGLSDEHPVMRLAEQPTSQPTRSPSYLKVAAPLAALAASIAIAFVAVRGTGDLDPVAQQAPSRSAPSMNLPIDDSFKALVDPSAIATSDDVANEDDVETIIDPANPTALAQSFDSSRSMQTDPSRDEGMPIPDRNAIASSDMAIPQSTPLASKSPKAQSLVPVSAILVLEVRLTMAGLDNDVIGNAMEIGGIEAASRKEINEDVVRFAKKNSELADEESSSASVLYLQAPMKKLDLFIERLIADVQGIESVRMSLATDTPLVRLVNSIRKVDPTTIQSESSSWRLDAGQLGNQALASHLSDRAFAGLDRASAQMGVVSSLGTTPSSLSDDIPASVLIVIR